MSATNLECRVQRLSRRVMAVRSVSGLGWSLVVVVLVSAAVVWLDLLWELPSVGRVLARSVVPAVGVFVLAGIVLWVARRSTSDALTRALDQLAGADGRIRAGVDLARTQVNSSSLTAGLIALAVADAGRLASSVPAFRVAPVRPVGWPLVGLAVVTLVAVGIHTAFPGLAETEWLRFVDPYGDHPPYSRVTYVVEPGDTRVVYGQSFEVLVATVGAAVERLSLVLEPADGSDAEALPLFAESDGVWRTTVTRVTQPVRYFVRSHAGRSKRFAVDVITVPLFEAVRFRITPPAYTLLKPYEGPLPSEGLAGLPGTRVELWAASNRPLSGGSLRLSPPPKGAVAVTPVAPDSSEVSATFEIRAAGQLRFTLTDTAGQESTEAFTAPIALLADERPLVRLVQPRELSLATPTATVPVVVAAEDDYGLSRVQLYRSLNNSRPIPVSLPLGPAPAVRVGEVTPLSLGGYGLKPGDEIQVFARAADTDPSGAKGAETPIAVVRIISQEDFEKMVRAREGLDVMMAKYRQAMRRMEAATAAAEELRKKRADRNRTGPAKDDDKAEAKALADRLRAEAEAIRKAAAHALGYDLDKNLTPQLERLAKQLDQAAKDLETELAKMEQLTQEELDKALSKMAGELDREKTDFEHGAIDPLDFLQSVMPLLRDGDKFAALPRRQRALATRLESLKEKDRYDDPTTRAEMRTLRAEQEEIRAALSHLLDEIEDHADRLPDKPELEELKQTARVFVEAVRKGGATDAMTDAEAGLTDFSGKRGPRRGGEGGRHIGTDSQPTDGAGPGDGRDGAESPSLLPGAGRRTGANDRATHGRGERLFGGQGISGSGGASASR